MTNQVPLFIEFINKHEGLLKDELEIMQLFDTKDFTQFLSDVLTAAGLVSHGKQSKGLGKRLSNKVMLYYGLIQESKVK